MSNAEFENLKRHVSRPEMIPGIHNYCDRWCERCSFTARCSVHTIVSRDDGISGHQAPGNREAGAEKKYNENEMFGELTGEALEAATDFLRDAAEEAGIDLDEVIESEVDKAIRLKERADEHPLVLAAREYTFAVHGWLDGLEGRLTAHIAMTDATDDTDGLREIAERAVGIIGDAIETIMRNHLLITTKLFRAVSHDFDFYAEEADLPSDADGSAKVALIAMDRSFAACYRLIDYLPEQERILLDFLVKLEKLRRGVEHAWPNARAFARPGFDDTEN